MTWEATLIPDCSVSLLWFYWLEMKKYENLITMKNKREFISTLWYFGCHFDKQNSFIPNFAV
jgi:hypothetical protein